MHLSELLYVLVCMRSVRIRFIYWVGCWKQSRQCVLFLRHTLARWLMKHTARSCAGYWRAALGPKPRRRNGIKGKPSVAPSSPVNSRLHFTAAAISSCDVSWALSWWVSTRLSCRCIHEKKKDGKSWSPSQCPPYICTILPCIGKNAVLHLFLLKWLTCMTVTVFS